MKLIKPTTEADMVAVFLQAEIASQRWRHLILDLLAHEGKNRAIIDMPDITNPADIIYRRHLLNAYRTYIFEELPQKVGWYRAHLTPDDLERVRYIDYDYWNELSNHTRLARVAAETIRAGREIFGVSNAGFVEAAMSLRQGQRFPELILVGTSPEDELTVFEGHVRLTAYLLAPECIPQALEVIAGFAPGCDRI